MIMLYPLDKKRLFCFLFFFYFSVYAISPLTYTFPEKGVDDRTCTPAAAATQIKSVRLFLWEFIIEKLAVPEEAAPDHARESIIIRKKRALLPKNTAATLLSFDAASIPGNSDAHPARIVVPIVEHDAIHGIRMGFSRLYAGHSPPSA